VKFYNLHKKKYIKIN